MTKELTDELEKIALRLKEIAQEVHSYPENKETIVFVIGVSSSVEKAEGGTCTEGTVRGGLAGNKGQALRMLRRAALEHAL